jgi:hypothetical protein
MAPSGYIDESTRERLEKLGQQARDALWVRDVAITEAVEAGVSLRAVGSAVGVSHATVRDIARRTRAALDDNDD